MNIKNLLGKLNIGRAGVNSTGIGNKVRVGTPEDAYRSGAHDFMRKAQTEEPLQANTGTPAKHTMHPVLLVSRFKYPYVKSKNAIDEDGEKTKVETGELGWRSTPNKDFADEAVNNLHAYQLYLYEDLETGQDVIFGQKIDENNVGINQPAQPSLNLANTETAPVETPEWYKEQTKKKARKKTQASLDEMLKRFAADLNEEPIEDDYSVDREVEAPMTQRYKYKGEITRFTTQSTNDEIAKYRAKVVPASSLGYRAYEVMPTPVASDLYQEPSGEDASKIPTWTKSILTPTEESPSAYGTSFRYRFSNGEPVPTLNGNKHVLSELLSIDGEKAPKDPGMNAEFNIYEFMTANHLWDKMDKHGYLPAPVKAQIADAEYELDAAPTLEHFTLGGGSLLNLGGKANSIMSEENLLARAMHHLGNQDLFTYVNTEGTEAFRPRHKDESNTAPLSRLESQLHDARRAYVSMYESMTATERKTSPELEEAAKKANMIGIKYIDLMATRYPSHLRAFVLKQPYVGHAPSSGDSERPGGRHESVYSLSPDSHLTDKGRTLATFEAGGGLQKLNADDRKLYALRKAFERNADNALNNQAKTLHSQRHAKFIDVPSESGEVYKIPVPRNNDGTWSKNAANSIDFIENHWLQNHLLNAQDKQAITQLQNEFAEKGQDFSFGQVASAYLKKQNKIKVKQYTQGASLLGSNEHFAHEGPFTFELHNGNEDEFVTLRKFTPQSDTAEKLKQEVLSQHLFNASDIETAEYLASKAPFENEDDVLFSLWANNLLKSKRRQATERAEKTLAMQADKDKAKAENSRGKPNGWPYALTSKRYDDEERAEFAGNLEDFVNNLKNRAGAVLDTSRKIVYIKPDGTQVTLPDSLPVELPQGAKMPMTLEKLKKIKNNDELAKYGIVRIKDNLYDAKNAKPVVPDSEGLLVIGDQHVPISVIQDMTPKEAVDKFNIFKSADGSYHYVRESDKIRRPIIEVTAQGGEKVALPADKLDERGLQMLVAYTEKTTGEKLQGGQVHAYPSDNDKIQMNHVYTELLNEGYSEENAYNQAKQQILRDKMNSVAVQCLSSGGQVDEQHKSAANFWIPEIIKTIEEKGNPQILEIMEDNYDGRDGLMNAAISGSLDPEDAQELVSAYNTLTGTTPQQGAYIKPIMKSVLMHGYAKESTPGLPNNKFWHILMSNAGNRFKDITLDSESGNDLGAQAMLHLLERPENPLEGGDLSRLLSKNSISLLEKTLKPAEKRIQKINPKFRTGARTAVEEWQAKPLAHLLAEHSDWLANPHIFTKDMIQEASQLANTQLVNERREQLFPNARFLDRKDVTKLNYAVAMSTLLQRKDTQSAKYPQQDIWDILMHEPGLDPESKEWQAKHKLSQYEAMIGKTEESLSEQNKLKQILGLKNSLEVGKDTPAIPLDVEDANAIIDQPMLNALSADLVKTDSRARIGIMGKANRALAKEASSTKSNHARGVVYPKHSVSQQSTEPLMITDDEGRERDITGYTPEDYEHITGAAHYNDDEFLSPETLMAINHNTQHILSGGNGETLLGQFRQRLNRDLLSNSQSGMSRATRAEMMYDAIYKMFTKYRHSVALNQQRLSQIQETNPKESRRLTKEIEHDTNVLTMIESYNVFEHLSKMIYYGKQFGQMIESIEDSNDVDNNVESSLIEVAKKYDLEAREVWNFITRTTYMDKKNIAKLEALGLGVSIGNASAGNESRLSQEDRDEVSSMVADKMDKSTRWFESPVAAVPAFAGADVHSKEPEQVEQLVNKEVDSVDSTELARFLARRGIMFAAEMGKLDKITGRQKTANMSYNNDSAQVKYSQDFTQSKDLSWFVHYWLQDADVADSMTEPGHDGLSTIDRAVSDLERLYAKPGGIYWGSGVNNSTLLEIAQPNALAYSLFSKYVDKIASENPAEANNVESLMQQATAKIASSVDEIHKMADYDNLDEDTQNKIDDAIRSASNASNNIGMKTRLIEEYTKNKNGVRVYEGTNPRNFSNAKSAIALQMANHHVVDELVKQDTSNQKFVSDGNSWRFEPKEIASYIAFNIGNEIISSLKHVERPGEWELVALSPVQAITGMQAGSLLTEANINKYINKRINDYQGILQSQWKVNTLQELDDDSDANKNIEMVINLALKYLDVLVGESMGANGSIDSQRPLHETMRNLQSRAQTVTTALQEDMNSKLNNPDENLQEVNDNHVLPALTRAKPSQVRNSVAKAMRNWSTGEATWPVVTTGIKNHGGTSWRAQNPGEPDEAYRAFLQKLAKTKGKSADTLIGYGSNRIEQMDAGALRDDALSGDIHKSLVNQLTQRLHYLRNPNSKNRSYKSAVHESQKSHLNDLQQRGLYPEYTNAPSGTGSWSHGNIGVLNLDTQDDTYNRIKQYKVRGHRNTTDTPQVEQVTPVMEPETVSPVMATVIDRLVRLASRLDAKKRYQEADFIDTLIHKLEVHR